MSKMSDGRKQNVCLVNLGLFRSGTTTLATAARTLGLKAYRGFPDLSEEQLKDFLVSPEKVVLAWLSNGGLKEIIRFATQYDILGDGWFALLPFLPPTTLIHLKKEARAAGFDLKFIATSRDIDLTVQSELHHWVLHDLERNSGLTAKERTLLEYHLRTRAVEHQKRIRHLSDKFLEFELCILKLEDDISNTWSQSLSDITPLTRAEWTHALDQVSVQNANPSLPVEGILLTLRLGNTTSQAKAKIASVKALLDQIEEDMLCRYLVVLAFDADEDSSDAAKTLRESIKNRSGQQLQSFHLITNPPTTQGQPFAICSAWHEMAAVAWENGADWVVLLGDDIEVRCPYHYRAFYRSFLDISQRLGVPLGFGCPWWNDETFPGFPSFPCIGKAHFEIFGGLIPQHRVGEFVNQDLDPYLHRLYLKFMATPCVHEARLSNRSGGHNGSGKARYERVPCKEWQHFATQDIEVIRKHLPEGTKEAILLDVVVPSFRVRLDYLEKICSLKVPDCMQALFIVIIDNTDAMFRAAANISQQSHQDVTFDQGERIIERHLSQSGNIVRVRCNKTNVGASASRNRGLDESSAEFVLNLDDDLIPNPDLLEQYGQKLLKIDDSVVGLIGLVRFPRSPSLPLRHAAVLMSYLTFMFEIAEQKLYSSPAWGVTANILFRRTKIRFDLAYAKTGGGEDVDFALRVAKASNGGKLLAVPEACVVHPFWPGSVVTLSSHFFNWAVGDGGLLKRFPEYRYWSLPNLAETLLLQSPLLYWIGFWNFLKLVVGFFVADFLVDFSNRAEYKHRCLLLQVGSDRSKSWKRSPLFYFSGHVLANFYVSVLECGRLWGHFRRGNLLRGICRRFDWHCGRLENAPWNFRKRELYKCVLFMTIELYLFVGWRLNNIIYQTTFRENDDTCVNSGSTSA